MPLAFFLSFLILCFLCDFIRAFTTANIIQFTIGYIMLATLSIFFFFVIISSIGSVRLLYWHIGVYFCHFYFFVFSNGCSPSWGLPFKYIRHVIPQVLLLPRDRRQCPVVLIWTSSKAIIVIIFNTLVIFQCHKYEWPDRWQATKNTPAYTVSISAECYLCHTHNVSKSIPVSILKLFTTLEWL